MAAGTGASGTVAPAAARGPRWESRAGAAAGRGHRVPPLREPPAPAAGCEGSSRSRPARAALPQPRARRPPDLPPAARRLPAAAARSAPLGSAPLRSPVSSVISGSSQEAIRLPWREVSPRDSSLQLAPANATPRRVRPWGRRPPGIPLPWAAPPGSPPPPPPPSSPPRSSPLGEMPSPGRSSLPRRSRPPSLHLRIHHPRASGPRAPLRATVPGGDRQDAARAGGEVRSSLRGRAETPTRGPGDTDRCCGSDRGSVQGGFPG